MRQKKTKPSKNHLLSVLLVSAALLLVSLFSCGEKPTEQVVVKTAEENPFLNPYNTSFDVPPFDKIKVEHYLPAFKKGMEQQQKEIEEIVNNTEAPTFANTVAALDRSGALWKSVELFYKVMKSADANEAFQKMAREIEPLIAKIKDDIRLNDKLFRRIKAVYQQKDQLNLSEEQAGLLQKFYKEEFVLNGANLNPEDKAKLRKINEELALLKLKFGNNVQAEEDRFQMVIEKKEDLEGLPQWVIDAAVETAAEAGHKGKWVFTTRKPSMIPFLKFSAKRELREKIFKAYTTRGDHNDQLDNKAILIKIAGLRIQKAKLLGFGNYAQYRLEKNMAKKPENVYNLLMKLWKPALAMAKQEAKQLQELINKQGGKFKLQPWDWWYYAEKLRNIKYALDDEIVRPYFKLENVIDGAFYAANKLWGLKFIERTDIPRYHPDVRVFEVQEADGSHVGILYTDFYPRAGKKNGAWMNSFRKQERKDGKNISPVITNNGNFPKPAGDTPSTLNFDQAKTLFHEFGHALHGLLSDCTYRKVSGTSVARDFVELPSQIMENWALDPEMLKIYAKHYKTGEVIPQELVDKIKKADLFNKGFETVEFLAAAFLDMDWHTLEQLEDPATFDVEKFDTQSMNKIGLIPEIVVRYRSTYFGHIFRGPGRRCF
jgi:peptidyl-dipeptidase Dcp